MRLLCLLITLLSLLLWEIFAIMLVRNFKHWERYMDSTSPMILSPNCRSLAICTLQLSVHTNLQSRKNKKTMSKRMWLKGRRSKKQKRQVVQRLLLTLPAARMSLTSRYCRVYRALQTLTSFVHWSLQKTSIVCTWYLYPSLFPWIFPSRASTLPVWLSRTWVC